MVSSRIGFKTIFLLLQLGRDSVADAAELSIALPRRIDRVLGEIEQGNLRVWTRVEDIEPLMKRLEHLVARSNATLLAAACIVGLAVVMQFYHPRGLQAWIGAVFWIAVAFAIIDYVRTLLTLAQMQVSAIRYGEPRTCRQPFPYRIMED